LLYGSVLLLVLLMALARYVLFFILLLCLGIQIV